MRLVPDFEQQDESAGLMHLTVLNPDGGWSREVPLRFLRAGSDLVVLAPLESDPRWAQSLSLNGGALWRIGDRLSEGSAERIDDPEELAKLLVTFASRFGDADTRRWFRGPVLGYRLSERGPINSLHAEIETYFDRLASQYDATLESNPIDRKMRLTSVVILSELFRPGDHVLEIGCGTGWETMPLVRHGVRVLATDVSGEMLRQLERKASRDRLSSLVETRKLRARDVSTLLSEHPPGSFDGAFSTFGALNCEQDLHEFPRAIHQLLRPEGTLVLGIWNRFCAAETILSLAALRPDRALARLNTPVPVGQSRFGVPVYAYGVREFVEMFRPLFHVDRILGLPVFVPPYDFGSKIASRGGLLSLLEGLDSTFAGHFPFNRLGDHFLMVMRRRP